MSDTRAGSRREDRIDITYDYEVCVWARHFNTSQQRLKEAVQAVGNRADQVREHLAEAAARGSARAREQRPSRA
jgi:methyl-accepting chemotaxis protein